MCQDSTRVVFSCQLTATLGFNLTHKFGTSYTSLAAHLNVSEHNACSRSWASGKAQPNINSDYQTFVSSTLRPIRYRSFADLGLGPLLLHQRLDFTGPRPGPGAPGIGRACGSSGGRSSDRKANRSASSLRSRIVLDPLGHHRQLARSGCTSRRCGRRSPCPPPGSSSTIRRSLSSVTSPVRLRPPSVTTVVVW